MKLNIVVHNHQPIGNFNSVIEDAYNKIYNPLLVVLEEHKNIKVNLHFTGPLWDWLANNRISFIDRIGRLIEKGQVELIGGPYYEPILSNLREKDILGQLALTKTKLKKLFGIVPDGVWVPEFVWEERMVKIFAKERANYTVLPEEHFRRAGVTEKYLSPYYITERYSKSLALFPIYEDLKNKFLDLDAESLVAYLEELRDKGVQSVTYMEYGEKIASTLGGDLETSLKLDKLLSLIEKSPKIKTNLLQETVQEFLPAKMIYIPSLNTKQMDKWSLPIELAKRYDELEKFLGEKKDYFCFFIRGGFWENFLTKYREANLLHKRLMHVSSRLEKFEDMIEKRTVHKIQEHIYKAQCNTAYWHGNYGGFYVPYLRGALFQNLILAEALLEVQLSKFGDPYGIRIEDFDGDRKDEIIYSSLDYAAFVGLRYGTVVELDNRSVAVNVANVIKRQRELNHLKLKDGMVSDKFPRDIGFLHIVPKDTRKEELEQQTYTDLLEHKKFKIIARSKRYVILESKSNLDISGHKIPIVIQKKYRFLKKGLELVISAFLEEELSLDVAMVLESNFNLMMDPWGKDLEKETKHFSLFNNYFSYGIKYNVETTDNIDKVILMGYEVNTVCVKDSSVDKTYQGTSLNYFVPVRLRPDKITELTLDIRFI